MNIPRAVCISFFPAFALLGWVCFLSFTSIYGTAIILPVHGYDPRDLLSGHYLTYTVDYGFNICGSRSVDENYCVCFSDATPVTVSWSGSCAERPAGSCTRYLSGSCSYRGFQAGIERYYIPESFSKPLARVPQGATIEIRLNGFGSAVVKDFKINGMSLEDYVRSQEAQRGVSRW